MFCLNSGKACGLCGCFRNRPFSFKIGVSLCVVMVCSSLRNPIMSAMMSARSVHGAICCACSQLYVWGVVVLIERYVMMIVVVPAATLPLPNALSRW